MGKARAGIGPFGVILVVSGIAIAQPAPQSQVTVDPDATIHAQSVAIPLSTLISPEARTVETRQITTHGWPMPAGPITGPGKVIDDWRRDMDSKIFTPGLERQKAVYPVTIERKEIAGVKADWVTPKDGVSAANKDRILINLHAGGYQMGAGAAALTEAIPVAAVGRIAVVTVDYRQGPEYKFPAASEDVAAVYRELLKTHRPGEIGIYGCSAGGNLTAASMAWFEKEKLPKPGAIGIFSSSAGSGTGDSTYFAPLLNGQAPPPLPNGPEIPAAYGYFAGTDKHDRLISPIFYPDLLHNFPPTLVMTATRDMAMSGALHTHAQLVKAGANAELHAWEGVGHCFFYNPDIPESMEAYDVITQFFDRHLAK